MEDVAALIVQQLKHAEASNYTSDSIFLVNTSFPLVGLSRFLAPLSRAQLGDLSAFPPLLGLILWSHVIGGVKHL